MASVIKECEADESEQRNDGGPEKESVRLGLLRCSEIREEAYDRRGGAELGKPDEECGCVQ